MIAQHFNNGWGNNYELRKFEIEIVQQYLRSWFTDNIPSVVVNSTWYNLKFHEQVRDFIQQNRIKRVALTSFVDAAIAQPDWFQDLPIQVRCLGYYRGADEIDAWALILDQYCTLHENSTLMPRLDTAFLCYNRKPHKHRVRLFEQLRSQDCLQHGIVTLGHESGTPIASLEHDVTPSDIAPNPGTEQYGIVNDIMSLGPESIWNRCFLNVVTETVFDVDTTWFVSEKIYKPIIGYRPFLVYAPQGACGWLQHIGIEPYLHDFSDISDLDLAHESNIAPFLSVLCNQGPAYYQSKYMTLRGKIEHNRNQFMRHLHHTRAKLHQGIQ
jgi:hypothetical protein